MAVPKKRISISKYQKAYSTKYFEKKVGQCCKLFR